MDTGKLCDLKNGSGVTADVDVLGEEEDENGGEYEDSWGVPSFLG